MASAFTKSFRSSSHLLASLPALLWVLVDLSSPGFHSAAFLVHVSWLCVGFRRAFRHFSFCFFPFLYETKLSPSTRQTSENKRERSAPWWRLSREQIRSQWPSQQSCQGAQLRRVHVCVSMFSSASFVLFFTSSRLSSWFVVFSTSSSNENLLSWSHALCVLISSSLLADFVMTNVFSSSFLLDFVFSFSLV